MSETIVGRVTVDEEVSAELVDNIITTAFEGGINYWADETVVVNGDYKGADYGSEVVSRGGAVKIHIREADEDEQEWYVLDLSTFLHGLQKYCTEGYGSVHSLNEDHDASDADIVIQFALFGQVVYG